MHDEEIGEFREFREFADSADSAEPVEFGSEVSRMLQRRAQRHKDHPDPVGVTRERLKAAAGRRQRMRRGAVMAVVAVAAGGAVVGSRAIAGGWGGSPGADGPGSHPRVTSSSGPAVVEPRTPRSSTSAPVTSAPSTTRGSQPTSVPSSSASTVPIGNDIVRGCDPNAPRTITAKNYSWPARGSLADDADFTAALLQRTLTLTGNANAKLVYSGEDASTRIAVFFTDPAGDEAPCGPDMQAVVFHGPKGTGADHLSAQIGSAFYNSTSAFHWAQRSADGSMSVLLVDAPPVREVKAIGVLGTMTGNLRTTIHTADGTVLTSYAQGVAVPKEFDFTDPLTSEKGTDLVEPVVTTPTAQGLAEALGIDPSRLTLIDPSQHMGLAYKVTGSGHFTLTQTTAASGAESVYWTRFG